MKKILVPTMMALILAVALIGELKGSSVSDESLEKKIAAVIKDRVDKHDRRFGIVVGTIDAKGRRVIAYGKAKEGVDVDGDSIFNLGSVAKLFTATLLADMVERGEVKLDDAIEQYLPPSAKVPARNGRKITLLDLATHTSGLPSIPGNGPSGPAGRPGYVDYSERNLYEFLSGYVLTRDIGSEYEYSNLGMGLLGFVLSRQGGKPLDGLFAERIWRPLGMDGTGSRERLSRGRAKMLTVGHYSDGGDAPSWPLSAVLAGAGGYHSSAQDMLRFLGAQMGIVSSPLIRAMQRAQQSYRKIEGSPGGEVGLGWGITRTEDGLYLTHGGGVDGYNSFVGINVKAGKGVVVLANSSVGVSDIGAAVLTDRLELPVSDRRTAAKEPAAFRPDPSDYGAYEGVFEISPGYNIVISAEKTSLFLQLPKQPRFEMTAESEDAFVIKDHRAEAWVQFLKDDLGQVTALSIRQDQVKATAKKIKAPVTAKVNPNVYAAHAGLYEIGPDLKIVITKAGDRLYAQASGQPEVEIFPGSENEYFSKLDDSTISFVKDDEGRTTGLLWRRQGNEKTAKRVAEPIAAAGNPLVYDDYLGHYQVTPEFSITVTIEDGRLFGQGTGQPRFELFPEDKDAFFLKAVKAKIRFRRDKDNRVVEIVVLSGSGEEIGKRIRSR
jgi:D-alanyl-D-alanine-carboxypeptidase/D-alanyl-D-alanine-endopeptidase